MVEGFKCFNKGLINNYGKKFEIGKEYHVDGDIQYGLIGNGFHMCTEMGDTFRYFPADKEEVDLCSCVGWGKTHRIDDEYNGYYNMYSCEYIKLIKLYKRKEIIEHMLTESDDSIKKFVLTYKLTLDEIELFENLFKDGERYNYRTVGAIERVKKRMQ